MLLRHTKNFRVLIEYCKVSSRSFGEQTRTINSVNYGQAIDKYSHKVGNGEAEQNPLAGSHIKVTFCCVHEINK